MELGYIYLLTCKSNKVYVGSCKNIKQRFWHHISHFNEYKNNKRNNIENSYLLFIDEDVKIHILEEVKYKQKNELLEREKYWIINYINIKSLKCVNKIINVVMSKEDEKQRLKDYAIKNKEFIKKYKKEYAIKNKEYLKQYKKEYDKKNRDKILHQKKEYYEKNKHILKHKYKENYEKNKDKINEKTICNICNIELLKRGLNRHNKTKKHLNNLAENKI